MRNRILAATCAALTIAPTSALAADGSVLDPSPVQATLVGHDGVTTAFRVAAAEATRQKLVETNLALARKRAKLAGQRVGRRYAAGAHRRSREALRVTNARLRREIRTLKAGAQTGSTGAGTSGTLRSIAQCESGGNPAAVGGGGAYRGKYQFDEPTWASVGGSGDPAAAPEAEQDRRAAALYSRRGASSWPVCGR